MKPSLIFDYDGTIHDTMRIYEPALRRAVRWLEENHQVQVPQISKTQIASWLGMNRLEILSSFLPELHLEVRDQAGALVGENVEKQVRAHQAAWYPGMEKVLDTLKEQGYAMAVLSNCQAAYGRAHWKEFHMERWFTAFYDCESFGYAPKTEIIQQLTAHLPGPYIVIGDRKHDLACAKASGSPFIGCKYGFGTEQELAEADELAECPEEILGKVLKLTGQMK